jgi:hypothetical protein
MSGLYEYDYKGVSGFDAVLSGTPLNSFLLRVLGGDKNWVWSGGRRKVEGGDFYSAMTRNLEMVFHGSFFHPTLLTNGCWPRVASLRHTK